ncbi:MAG TPA: hypothetical protein VEU07_12470, partial [Candidatus Acidoferrum sp.]|nr:hypothetical protein [Candidatus Acidoferrum sp.]
LAGPAHGAFTLIGLAIEDAVTRQVVERYTLARQLQPVRFLGSIRTTEWLLDRPPLAPRWPDTSTRRWNGIT